MRLTAALILVLAAALPASGAAVVGITVNGTTATWSATASLADVQEARAAILWQRESMALMGAVFTAAISNLAVTDNGDGTGTMRIAMPRTAGGAGFDAWADAYAVSHCPEAVTPGAKLDCVEAAILADLRQVVYRYRHHLREQSSPVTEPDL
jgi:hypothetical protein